MPQPDWPDFPPLEVLYEDNHLLVVSKPAQLATMGVKPEQPSLVVLAKHYLKQKYHKPGNVYLGVVSRLDAPVTGVVVIARTSKAAARLSEQFRTASVHKIYWALVEQPPQPPEGACLDWIQKDERHRKMYVTRGPASQAKQARLLYRTLSTTRSYTLLEIQPQTGRKHQIRLQLAHRGWSILGDYKYGSRKAFPQGIALHARQLELIHPVRKTPLKLEAPLPESWRKFRVPV